MRKLPTDELRATLTVAAVYGYFLIFAQFSFVELMRAGGAGPTGEKMMLGVMAVAGIAGGFLTAWRGVSPKMARAALVVAGLAVMIATASPGIVGFVAVGLIVGASLGVVTVCLAALLPSWCGVAWVGLGTGLAYSLCNVPAIFQQEPVNQAWVGLIFAMIGVIAMPSRSDWPEARKAAAKPMPFWAVLVVFTALVWMDSAAFFIIQHVGNLKSGTWGESLLWRNAAVHLAFACLAGAWLARGGAKWLPAFAWIGLAIAALLVNEPATRGIGGWIYPAGVSLYSAALVAWPGWFSGASDPKPAAWRAAWLFAIAGWFGSANGIGMAQSLAHVPPAFVVVAGVAVAGVMALTHRQYWRAWLTVGAVALAAWCFSGSTQSNTPPTSTAAERGRRVYLAEGCLHCHSQYVRPGSPDERIWGAARNLEKVLEGEPVLIGNRRQGPDLLNVGARRSPAWLKAHFIEPPSLIPNSSMPSYAHLFDDRRGDDLVRYLIDSGAGQIPNIRERASQWKPAITSGGIDGKALFNTYCVACHGAEGRGDGPLAKTFAKPPANLVTGPFLWTPPGEDLELRVARVVKFGVIGTDMPGHEVLTDESINSLVAEILKLRAQ